MKYLFIYQFVLFVCLLFIVKKTHAIDVLSVTSNFITFGFGCKAFADNSISNSLSQTPHGDVKAIAGLAIAQLPLQIIQLAFIVAFTAGLKAKVK